MKITTMAAVAITVAMGARADEVTVYVQGVSVVPTPVEPGASFGERDFPRHGRADPLAHRQAGRLGIVGPEADRGRNWRRDFQEASARRAGLRAAL
jgi:hypothetical protein